MKIKVQKPRGMKDLYGEEADLYLKFRELATEISLLNNFKYIETPVVEDEKTFTLSLGTTSDVVEKEMFYLKGKEKGEKFVLKPEGTAAIVRAYFENGMMSLPQPVMLFYIDRMYRKERPQHGRLREHRQWGLEILNTDDSFADFFIINIYSKFLQKLKINDFVAKLNSLGCENCHQKFKNYLIKYYKNYRKKLCPDCQRRFTQNPLRLLDCKKETCQSYKENAPNILDYLCKACKIHFQKLLEQMDYFRINYELDKTLVRGFDYYQRTVFEIFVEGETFALCSGGRYDLGEIVAKSPLPSVGGALGFERLQIILDNLKVTSKLIDKRRDFKIFVAFAGEEARPKAVEIYEELQKSGFKPLANFFKLSLSQQLEYANKFGTKYSLILGFQELGKESIILKDMEYGTQETLKLKNLVKELKKIIRNE